MSPKPHTFLSNTSARLTTTSSTCKKRAVFFGLARYYTRQKNTHFLARPSLWLFLPNSFYVWLNSQNTHKAARRKIPNRLLSKNVMPFRNVSPRVSRLGNFEKGRSGWDGACLHAVGKNSSQFCGLAPGSISASWLPRDFAAPKLASKLDMAQLAKLRVHEVD